MNKSKQIVTQTIKFNEREREMMLKKCEESKWAEHRRAVIHNRGQRAEQWTCRYYKKLHAFLHPPQLLMPYARMGGVRCARVISAPPYGIYSNRSIGLLTPHSTNLQRCYFYYYYYSFLDFTNLALISRWTPYR